MFNRVTPHELSLWQAHFDRYPPIHKTLLFLAWVVVESFSQGHKTDKHMLAQYINYMMYEAMDDKDETEQSPVADLNDPDTQAYLKEQAAIRQK